MDNSFAHSLAQDYVHHSSVAVHAKHSLAQHHRIHIAELRIESPKVTATKLAQALRLLVPARRHLNAFHYHLDIRAPAVLEFGDLSEVTQRSFYNSVTAESHLSRIKAVEVKAKRSVMSRIDARPTAPSFARDLGRSIRAPSMTAQALVAKQTGNASRWS